MSDYVYKKAGRLPIAECPYSLDAFEDYLNKRSKESYKFDLMRTETRYYIDYVIESRYGEDCSDYGFAFELNREERYKYAAEFDKLNIEYNKNDLVGIIQCYYNGYEPPDIYEVKGFDEL